MDIEINYRPSQTAAKVKLNQAEGFYAEGGSMIAMSGGVDIETSTHQKNKGGLFSGIKRMLAGENFFLNQYKAKSG
ncbi:MAG: AIM24 family protein, partial [Bdellovibrionota bacterium]|nr:AIM24 family protein [Bdellovibrionota bacterium]